MNQNHSIKDFLPLIVLLALITALTLAKLFILGPADLHAFMTAFMGFFFVIFGGFKIANLTKFAEAYSMYDLIAKRSRVYALAYPFIELALGASYLLGWYPMITNLITLVIMTISAAGVGYTLSQGQHVVCACLGALFKIPMTYVTLAEDLLMAAMALIMLVY